MSDAARLAALDLPADDLELVGVGRSGRDHELRAAGAAVLTLQATGSSGSGALAQVRGQAWEFAGEGRLRPRVVVRDRASGDEVAVLRTKGVTGAKGTVELAGRELASRTEGKLADRWVLLDGDRPVVSLARDAKGERYTVTCARDADLLLLVIACYGAVQSSGAAAAATATG